MAGLRETTAISLALCAWLASSTLPHSPAAMPPLKPPEAPLAVEMAALPAEAPVAVELGATIFAASEEASPTPFRVPEEVLTSRVPLRLTLLRLPELSPLPAATTGMTPTGMTPTRTMLAGTDTPATPAEPLTGAVLRRSAAEQLAARRGLALDDVRVAIDLRPSAVTFWIGSAAKDGILRDIATQPWNADWGADIFYGASYSHRIGRPWTDIAVDVEAGGGYRAGDTNSPEAWVALYGRYDGFSWRNRLYTSVAISTGLHWMNNLPESETGTAAQPEPNQSKLLHYLSPEITFSLPNHLESEIAIRYAHRSGIFGTFNGVYEGSNVLTIGYRRRL